MGNKKVWIILLAVVVVIAGVIIGVIVGDKNNQVKLAADLQQQVDTVAKERDALKTELATAKTDAEAALAAAKGEADTALTAAKEEADKLAADKDVLIAQAKEEAEAALAAAKEEADKLAADKDVLIAQAKEEAEAALAAKEEADKLAADKDILIAQAKEEAEAALAAKEEAEAALAAAKDEAQKALDEIQAKLDEAVKAKTEVEKVLEALKQEIVPVVEVIDEPEAEPVADAADNAGVAYILFADSASRAPFDTAEVSDVKVAGVGDYAVAVKFSEPVEGVSVLALGVVGGEELFPNYVFTVTGIKLNGESVAMTGKPYTASDGGIETRVNLYNASVAELPADARCAEGDVAECTPIVIDPALFTGITDIEIAFTVTESR